MRLIGHLALFAAFAVILPEVPARAQELAQLRRRAMQVEHEIAQIRELAFKWSIDIW